MNYQDLLAAHGRTDRPARAALIGVGQFGRTLLMQSRRMAALDLAVLCDLDIEGLKAACLSAGLGEEDFTMVDTQTAAARTIEAGRLALTENPEIATGAPVDVVVEATGNAEAGARNVSAAIEQGRHVVLVTKETDSVVGPLLAHRAKRAGLVLSQVDGDQPSLLLALISWARALELEIACAGKASEYDFVFDPRTGMVRAEGFAAEAALDPSLWSAEADRIEETLEGRAEALATIPRRTPPDYCELCLVANGSGLKPDRPDLHAPIARMIELPDSFRPRAAGNGRLDIFNCLRRPDEISAAGGVFLVLEAPDSETGGLFAAKGIPVSGRHDHLLVYNPTHLLGVEAPLSILIPHRLGLATGSGSVTAVCDVAMRASRDLAAGTLLSAEGHHHEVEGTDALLIDYAPLAAATAIPYYLAAGHRLARDVRKGDLVTCGAVERPIHSQLWSLRDAQDRLLGSA